MLVYTPQLTTYFHRLPKTYSQGVLFNEMMQVIMMNMNEGVIGFDSEESTEYINIDDNDLFSPHLFTNTIQN